MSTDDRIQPPAASAPATAPTAVQPATAPTAVQTAPTTSTAVKAAHGAPNPIATRAAELIGQVKPFITPRLLYSILAIVLVIGGYYLIRAFLFDKTPNSKRWEELSTLDDAHNVRVVAHEVLAADKPKPDNFIGLSNDWTDYQTYKIYRSLLEDFANKNRDTTQARVARMQMGRYLMIIAMRDIGSSISSKQENHAAEILQLVAEVYEKLEPQLSSDPTLQEEVILTQAKARESLGDLDKAETLYRKLVDSEKTKSGAAGTEAAACLARLKDPKARQEAINLADLYVKSPSKQAGP